MKQWKILRFPLGSPSRLWGNARFGTVGNTCVAMSLSVGVMQNPGKAAHTCELAEANFQCDGETEQGQVSELVHPQRLSHQSGT